MDPLTHTLVGANLAACPPARRLSMATPALLIGANLPDIDVVAYFAGDDFALGFRRGWTHGWPALVVLPSILWLALLVWSRMRGRGVRRPRPVASPHRLLAACYLATLTHPCLDWLNTYGMRWRMPLDGTWFYGDSLFIIDPWLWALLGGVWWLGRRTSRAGAPVFGLAVGLLYISGLVGLHAATEARVRSALAGPSMPAGEDLLVGPRPANPLVWDVVVRQEGRLEIGRFRWLAGELALDRTLDDARADPRWPNIEAAARDQAPGFLGWARFPWLEVEETAGGDLEVYLMDARYVRRRTTGFGGTRIHLENQLLPSSRRCS